MSCINFNTTFGRSAPDDLRLLILLRRARQEIPQAGIGT